MIHEGLTPLGIVIALFYVGCITSILWWMLHVPPVGDVEAQVRRTVRMESSFRRIVVPLQGDIVSGRLMALASQMAKFRGATLDALYVIEVPLTLPINADMTAQEEMAREAFLQAARLAAKYDVKINKHVERARHAGPAIVQYVTSSNADIVMMSDVPKSNNRGTRYSRSVEYVFEHAPCEVILDRPAMDDVMIPAAVENRRATPATTP